MADEKITSEELLLWLQIRAELVAAETKMRWFMSHILTSKYNLTERDAITDFGEIKRNVVSNQPDLLIPTVGANMNQPTKNQMRRSR